MIRFIVSVMPVFAALIAACGTPATVTPEGLTVAQDTETAYAGRYAPDAAHILEFEAVVVDEARTVSAIRVGDAVFETVFDLEFGEVQIDGHGAVITESLLADARALRDTLDQAFHAEGEQHGGLAPHHAMLYGQAAWLADAQVGYVVGAVAQPIDALDVAADGQMWFGYGNDGTSCLTKGASATYHAENDSGSRNTGTFTVNSTKSCSGSATGCGSWDGACMGQCGAGCQWSWRNGVFRDCHDHDHCTYFWTNCGDQWWQASDDYIVATFGSCR